MNSAAADTTPIRASVLHMGLPAAAARFAGPLYAPIDLWFSAPRDDTGLMDEQVKTFSVRVRDTAVSLAERGFGVGFFFSCQPLHCQHRM
jgi:hypothetical protein